MHKGPHGVYGEAMHTHHVRYDYGHIDNDRWYMYISLLGYCWPLPQKH